MLQCYHRSIPHHRPPTWRVTTVMLGAGYQKCHLCCCWKSSHLHHKMILGMSASLLFSPWNPSPMWVHLIGWAHATYLCCISKGSWEMSFAFCSLNQEAQWPQHNSNLTFLILEILICHVWTKPSLVLTLRSASELPGELAKNRCLSPHQNLQTESKSLIMRRGHLYF